MSAQGTSTRATLLRNGAKAGAFLLLSLGAACGREAAPPAAGAPGDRDAPVTVKIGGAALEVGYWPLYIGLATGGFGRRGLKRAVNHFETPAAAAQALATGATDVGTFAIDLAIGAAEKGVPLASVAGVYNKATYSLVTARGITSYGDLRGKALAVSDLKDAT